MRTTLLLTELAHVLTDMGDPLPAKQLTEALKWPENPKKLQEALTLAANCKHSDVNRAKRLRLVAEALQGVPGPELVQKLRAAKEEIKEATTRKTPSEQKPTPEPKQPGNYGPPPMPPTGGTDTEATPVKTAGNRGKNRGTSGRGRSRKQAANPARLTEQRRKWPPLDP